MDPKRFFTYTPDGRGFGEDPASLQNLFLESERNLFCGGIRTVHLTRIWHPLSCRLDTFERCRKNLWQRGCDLAELYRFGEALLAATYVLEADHVAEVNNFFEQAVPQHLQGELFGLPIDDSERPAMTRIFRRAFRGQWLVVNCDETVAVVPTLEDDEVVWRSDRELPAEIRESVPELDLNELARRVDYRVNRELRDGTRTDRLAALLNCERDLEDERTSVTACLKAAVPPSERRLF
jgi:hypothetical protein